jgi:hypothetical protein
MSKHISIKLVYKNRYQAQVKIVIKRRPRASKILSYTGSRTDIYIYVCMQLVYVYVLKKTQATCTKPADDRNQQKYVHRMVSYQKVQGESLILQQTK